MVKKGDDTFAILVNCQVNFIFRRYGLIFPLNRYIPGGKLTAVSRNQIAYH
ncbi:MAG: hypothetical protein ACYS3N_13515 [Planctomycetota bacterium]|jgi:hypothetical protein